MGELLDTSEVRQLAARLGEYADGTEDEVRKVLNESIERVYERAKSAAPFRTGELEQSIRRTSSSRTDLYRRVWSTVRQGFFQEYGTFRHGPQPWLTPALRAEEQTFVEAVGRAAGRPL